MTLKKLVEFVDLCRRLSAAGFQRVSRVKVWPEVRSVETLSRRRPGKTRNSGVYVIDFTRYYREVGSTGCSSIAIQTQSVSA